MALDRKPLVTITSTFRADPIEDTIDFWLRKLGLPFGIKSAAHHRVFQELIGEESLLNDNRDGVNILLLRLEDWQGVLAGAGSLPSQIKESSQEFVEALRAAAQRSAVPYLVCLCPASPAAAAHPARSAELSRAERTIVAGLRSAPTVQVVTPSDVAEIFEVKTYHSPQPDQPDQVPYTSDYFTVLGTMMSRRIWALRSRPHKVIVLDCDGTLWKGTCAEDGADGVQFGRPWHFLQEFMVKQFEAGMLLCICSKSSQKDVVAVLDRHRGEMPLRPEHIVSWRVNGMAKSESLRSLATELGLSLDRFIVLDVSPLECAEIESNCPEVLTLQLPPEEENIPTFLRRVWAFDPRKITGEVRSANAIQFPLATMLEHPPLGARVTSLEGPPPAECRHVVTVNPGGARVPIVLVSGLGGYGVVFQGLARLLEEEQRVIILDAVGAGDESEGVNHSIEQLAAIYEAQILAACPADPVILGGYSFGSLVAYEIAHRLRLKGRSVPLLVSFDGFGPGFPKLLPLPERLLAHAEAFVSAGATGRRNYIGARLAGLRRRAYERLGRPEAAEPVVTVAAPETHLRLRRLAAGLNRAAQLYQPRHTTESDMLLIKTSISEQWIGNSMNDPLYGWSSWARGQIEVVTVPGEHLAFFDPANQRCMADALGDAIQRRGLNAAEYPPSAEREILTITSRFRPGADAAAGVRVA
jgi:thioesterase domain-containing protein